MTDKTKRSKAAAIMGKKGGSVTAKRRTPQERREIARRAAQARWERARKELEAKKMMDRSGLPYTSLPLSPLAQRLQAREARWGNLANQPPQIRELCERYDMTKGEGNRR